MGNRSSLYCLLKGKTRSLAELTKRKAKSRSTNNRDKPSLPPYCVPIPSLRPTLDPEIKVGMRVHGLRKGRMAHGEVTPTWQLKLDSGKVIEGILVTHVKIGLGEYLELCTPVVLRRPTND
jgi:hypothetical protein